MEARFLTPPQFAKEIGVEAEKVLNWIRSGELSAVNVANRDSRRPRYRISPQAIDAFLARRSVVPPPARQLPRRRLQTVGVIEFF